MQSKTGSERQSVDITVPTIIVTRAKDEAGNMIERLNKAGLQVIHAPVVSFGSVLLPVDIKEQFLTGNFELIVFTSVHGVNSFFSQFSESEIIPLIRSAIVCAVGQSTAAALYKYGITRVQIPSETSAAGLVEALGTMQVNGKRVLLPGGNKNRKELPEGLRKLGAEVVPVIVYENIAYKPENLSEVRAIMQSGAKCCIVFASPSAVQNFMALVQETSDPKELGNCSLAAIGATTAAELYKMGYLVSILPAEPTEDELTTCIIEFYKDKGALL